MLAFHMFCHEDAGAVVAIARDRLNRYLRSLVDAASGWMTGSSSDDYRGYDRIIENLSRDSYEHQIEIGAAWMGTPDEIAEQIRVFSAEVGGFDIASMQINFNDLPLDDASRSLELFATEVMPQFAHDSSALAHT
jgi:alkanesulfonate monooxygenase SsuD/methylene tetrahydromethanopterin reductase-like flavin-dependent oxidoreductase (luciferase family)